MELPQNNVKKHIKNLVLLIVLHLLVDILYLFLYPSVNPLRATFIGATAFVVLYVPVLRKVIGLPPGLAFLPIYSSALFGALLVQADIVTSKSTLSAVAHVLILIVTYIIIAVFYRKKK